ncbi:MAG: hypothetical protein ACJ8LG_19485 [Massilia sp.]
MHNADAGEFLGPSLCSAALALLIPLTAPKAVHVSTLNLPEKYVFPATYSIRKIGDEQLVGVVLIVLLMGLAAWTVCLYLSLGGTLPSPLRKRLEPYDVQLSIGAIVYAIAAVLTEVKEHT